MEYREDPLWQESYKLARLIRTTFLAVVWSNGNQIRRSASSIHANIAEGLGRANDNEFAQFCRYSLGSAFEASSLAYEALEFGLIDEKHQSQIDRQLERYKNMLEERLAGHITSDETP